MATDDARGRLRHLSRWFESKRDALGDMGTVGVDDLAVRPLLRVWAYLLDWAEKADLTSNEAEALATAATEAQSEVGNFERVVGNSKALALISVRGNLDVFASVFNDMLYRGVDREGIDEMMSQIGSAMEESERMISVMTYVTQRSSQLDKAVEEATQAANDAREALELAQRAATSSATSALESSFQETALSSARAAFWFRVGTIGTLAVTVAFGLFYAAGTAAQTVDNWHEVVYRVAILSALAGIAAYLGRQASNYHRIATWARAIEIQLKAFLGFINEIENEEARQTMYALFAKRVLEAPPDGKASNDEVTNLIQPIIDQAVKLKPNA